MTRTFTKVPDDANVAASYNILSNGVPFRIPSSKASADTMMFASISVRASMTDALRLYQAILNSLNLLVPAKTVGNKDETRNTEKMRGVGTLPELKRNNTNPGSHRRSDSVTLPIKQPLQLFLPYITRDTDSIYEQTTALGWNRTQLPGKLQFGWNSSNISSIPLFGKGFPEKLAFWHGGNLPGTTVAVILFPETRTAVVVMQNSLGVCDAADLISQLLSDCLFIGGPQHDYVSLAEEATRNGLARMERVAEQLQKEREPGTKHRPLDEYVGQYENSIKNWMIEIGLDGSGRLFLRFQGRVDEQYSQRYHHYDAFVWNLSYDETVERAQYCRPHEFYRFHFEARDGRIYQLRWHHDPNILEGEEFVRQEK
ncbi:hypothetical protein BS50DRAFT_180872 [Corynespora cassiicola Philippines]|uniref:Peptidase S12 Pab87-related C-terminal domain-containing protein n=1 Tax=Corynespora cassiicola Philippines TaxID=1448308 RepID=A0A2T2P621_CORCC|nr:hypothetical protein BS50DRAFT_180872 [Corynespora cassiicola Philippines]